MPPEAAAQLSAEESFEGRTVGGKYLVGPLIGSGGMGTVWLGQHMQLDTRVAIKFIRPQFAERADARRRFEIEARAAASVDSKHAVKVYDYGVTDFGLPYIVMEYLEGESLSEALIRRGPFPADEAAKVIAQAAKALSKAHAANIVHRDLKPDNIFLVNDDDGRKITKILDFGVAKSTSQSIDGSNTKTGAMLGTPYYMSPEQAQGIKSVDSRSDLWSLAVIVFQCVTGRLPFESEALGDLLVKIIVSPIPTPSEVHRGVPPGFDTWWRRAADRNPDGRFQTAKEFAQSLEMALGQSSVTEVNFDRSKLQKMGGGTAMMPAGPLSKSNPPPGALTAAVPGPHMSTPNPANHGAGHGPMMHTPPGAMAPMAHAGSNPHMGTANPVVAETPIELPKKGPPVALIAAVAGGFALVGAILAGVAMFGGKKATAGGGEGPTTSASVAMTASAPTSGVSTEAKNAPPPPTADSAIAKHADPDPPASASAAASIAAKPVTPPIGGGGAIAAKPAQPTQPATKPAQPAQPTTPPATKPTTPTKPTGPAGGLGF